MGDAPLAAAPDTEGLGADEVEQPPVEQPPPPLGLAVRAPATCDVGTRVTRHVSPEDGRDHVHVGVHPLQPGVQGAGVVHSANSPLEVVLSINDQGRRNKGLFQTVMTFPPQIMSKVTWSTSCKED